mmetsp:Transcript_115476/g.299314  ORF Transcript_115476/g.299314 Transcript_115476/m.299314 type:complete len:247 (+) Transcript_115476:316-1056(+)
MGVHVCPCAGALSTEPELGVIEHRFVILGIHKSRNRSSDELADALHHLLVPNVTIPVLPDPPVEGRERRCLLILPQAVLALLSGGLLVDPRALAHGLQVPVIWVGDPIVLPPHAGFRKFLGQPFAAPAGHGPTHGGILDDEYLPRTSELLEGFTACVGQIRPLHPWWLGPNSAAEVVDLHRLLQAPLAERLQLARRALLLVAIGGQRRGEACDREHREAPQSSTTPRLLLDSATRGNAASACHVAR